MARVWMEGFENGLPHGLYLEGNPQSNHINGFSIGFPAPTGSSSSQIALATGRNAYSLKCLSLLQSALTPIITKTLDSALSEVYFRCWLKHTKSSGASSDSKEMIWFTDGSGNKLFSLYNENNTADDFALYCMTAGSYTKVADVTLSTNTWYRLDVRLKIDSSAGAYNIMINGASIVSETDINTGSANVATIKFGHIQARSTLNNYLYVDDIALNDTTGSKNNSWCGAGTIVGLKPKAAGSSSEWTSSQGWALGEDGTSTTNIEITGHGLATNDVIYNVTRDAYRIVTKVDDNNLTVSSVTSQTQNDVFVLFAYAATISAGSGTSNSKVVLSGHTLESYDAFVNTSRSNAVRRAIYVDGTSVYNYAAVNADYTGSTVTSQASGDSIKTFKVLPYAISDHYKAVYTANPNPQYSNIQSSTSGHIDTFDMEELVADKSVPTNTGVIAVSHNIYAKEKGAGSQMNPVFRIDGSEYSGSTITLTTGTLQYQTIYEDSPATDDTWDLAEIDALEAGVEVA